MPTITYTDYVPAIRSARNLMSGAAVAGARPDAQVASKGLLDSMQRAALNADASANSALDELQTRYIKNTTATVRTLTVGGIDWTFAALTTYAVEPLLSDRFLKEAARLGFTNLSQVVNADFQATGAVETFFG